MTLTLQFLQRSSLFYIYTFYCTYLISFSFAWPFLAFSVDISNSCDATSQCEHQVGSTWLVGSIQIMNLWTLWLTRITLIFLDCGNNHLIAPNCNNNWWRSHILVRKSGMINTAGDLKPDYELVDVMIINDNINLLGLLKQSSHCTQLQQ